MEEVIPVQDDDTAEILYMRCTEASVKTFGKIMAMLIAAQPLPRKKQSGTPHYFGKEMPNGGQTDLSWDKETIERFIRATTFEPVSRPWLEISGVRYEVIQKS